MSEPLPHNVNIARRLADLRVDGTDPMIFILGSRLVTAETDARLALRRVAAALAKLDLEGGSLDSFYGDELDAATKQLAEFHRVRRELLVTAEEHDLVRLGE